MSTLKAETSTDRRSPSPSTGRSALLVLGLLLVATPAVTETPYRWRWIERQPEAVLDLDPHTQGREVARRGFSEDRWRLVRGQLASDERRFELLAPEGRIELDTEATFDAAAVDRFELELEAPAPGAVELWWAAPGRGFEARHRVRTRAAGGRQRLHFEVGRHARWQGIIGRLRLVLHRHAGDRIRLHTLIAQRVVFDALPTPPGARRSGSSGPAGAPGAWQVALDDTRRPARVSHAGGPPLRWPLPGEAARRGTTLRLALGTAAYPEPPLELRIVAEVPGAEGESVLLHEQRLGRLEGGRWHPVEVPLIHRLADDGSVVLRFEAETAGGRRREGPVPVFWAHPQVVDGGSTQRPPNLVLISVDTLRADRLSLLGNPRRTSPNIDRWAAERAVIFEHALAAAPWTLPSHVSMLSGVDVLGHGVQHDAMAQGMPRLLAERLRRAGYHGEAITGGAYLHPAFGFGRGFEGFRAWPAERSGAAELVDGVERALAFLEHHGSGDGATGGGPFFLFFHTYSVHDPYLPRKPFFERFAPEGSGAPPPGTSLALIDRPRTLVEGFREDHELSLRRAGGLRTLDAVAERPLIEAYYDSGVAFIDRHLGRLLEALEALDEDTVVVLTSDHGEALGDRGGALGHVDLHDHTLRVPLLIAPPRGIPGLRVRRPVALIDLVPTLLDLLALPACDGCDGRTLVPLMAPGGSSPPGVRPGGDGRSILGYGAASNHGLVLRDATGWELHLDNNAWREKGRPRLELHHRADGDPHGLVDRSVDHPGRRRTLEDELVGAWNGQAQGLRLRLQNPGAGALRGELRGTMILPTSTKSVDLACPCLEWVGEGRARFTLGPGDAFTLLFEDVPDDGGGVRLDVRLEARDPRGKRKRHSTTLVPIPEPGQSAAVALRDGRFEPTVPPRLGSDPGLALVWHGPPRPRGESPTRLDADLRRRLEALGYW